ncbi:uncharacterized protein LOC141849921 [Brevipalpus obovatus]|uniref:uncharacterized protein LOC141849921 n=1 Tax=Brevipalpus obovatus TaxID=246614 RepID=UPI003D9F4A3B
MTEVKRIATLARTSSESSTREISRVVIFGQLCQLSSFGNETLRIEFWLEPDPGWQPSPNQPDSLRGVTNEYISKGHETNIGCPFEFGLIYRDKTKEEIHLLQSVRLFVRVVRLHRFGRESTRAFGCLVIPFRAGFHEHIIETFNPCSNRLFDRLVNEFFDYSFDVENLKRTHYNPIGLINCESRGFLKIQFNLIVQSRISFNTEDFGLMRSNIVQIVVAFRRARQRLIWLKMKALQSA